MFYLAVILPLLPHSPQALGTASGNGPNIAVALN